MDRIKIIGGGIAGLTAAINLKKAGLDVEVHERKHHCGKHTRDFQFLENWTFSEDALDMLDGMGIQTDFYIKPWYSQEIICPSGKKYVGTSRVPLMYLIKRGSQEGSLDRAIEKQALGEKITIIYNSKLSIKDANIVATGIRNPTFIATGVKFDIVHPDISIVLLDDNMSPKMYSYFIVNDNLGQIVSINPVQRGDHIERLGLTMSRFEQILATNIHSNGRRFSAAVNFYFLRSAKANNQYFVGEAAGFQDCLAGFGMMYAFKSGYFAAKSIIKSCDYDRMWQEDFMKPMQISLRNRRIFEKLSNRGYETMVDVLNSENKVIRKLLGGNDLRMILKKVYNYSVPKPLRPLLHQYRSHRSQI